MTLTQSSAKRCLKDFKRRFLFLSLVKQRVRHNCTSFRTNLLPAAGKHRWEFPQSSARWRQKTAWPPETEEADEAMMSVQRLLDSEASAEFDLIRHMISHHGDDPQTFTVRSLQNEFSVCVFILCHALAAFFNCWCVAVYCWNSREGEAEHSYSSSCLWGKHTSR